MEHVILVDERDHEIGTMEKMEAHQKGLLHRAFSILIFNSKGELLLQQRALSKYHSGGLWTNSCCSHPRPGESTQDAAKRKLKQEMGIDLIPEFAFTFKYKAELDHGLTEHELDHVYFGKFDGEPKINHEEAIDWRFVDLKSLHHEIQNHSEKFTAWFKIILNHPELSILT
jgi:isopentenyl-diphosphate Delta-isomerase